MSKINGSDQWLNSCAASNVTAGNLRRAGMYVQMKLQFAVYAYPS